MVGKDYEEGGMIKYGLMMINVVFNLIVLYILLLIGVFYGVGYYGMCGCVYDLCFLFVWFSVKFVVMGGVQLLGVLFIVVWVVVEVCGQ